MDAIFLRPQPTNFAVRLLSRLLLAAPMAISIAFVSQRVFVRWQGPSNAASRPELTARLEMPAAPSLGFLRSLPVQPDLFVRREKPIPLQANIERDQISRQQSLTGVSLDEAGLKGHDGSRFELEGVEMPNSDALCRRLDGVSVSCRERIAARLEILSRIRAIDCQVTRRGNHAIARCLAGKVDLADDLLRNGLVRKSRRASDA